jgi:HPt (histidine-containing phosphotransfer) domain-containing protein
MPVMDGFEATRILRARGFTGPILAFTADASPAVAAQCRQAGMNACLAKPLIAGDILLALGSALPPSRSTVMTPQGPEDLPVFEYQQTLDRLDGDTDLLRLVAQTFCKQIPVVFQQIASAVTAADLAEARRHLHSLKGASAVCGARQVQALALSLQQAADAGALVQLQARLPALEAALGDFEQVFTASQDGPKMRTID